MRDIKAEAVTETLSKDENGRFNVTLTDCDGRLTTLSLTPAVAADLLQVLNDYCVSDASAGPEATKIPSTFAVGAARYEPLVLLRFESESPYGLEPAEARALGQALIEQADELAWAPKRLHH